MSDPLVIGLVRALVAGGLVLLTGWALGRFCRQPARRAWIGMVTASLALLVVPLSSVPGWFPGIAWPTTPTPVEVAAIELPRPPAELTPPPMALEWVEVPLPAMGPIHAQVEPTPIATVTEEIVPAVVSEPTTPSNIGRWVAIVYVMIVSLGVMRLVVGHLVLGRWWCRSVPAPDWVNAMFRDLSRSTCPNAQLRISSRVRVPLCFGLVRPRAIVPVQMLIGDAARTMRPVLAHELGHLRRRDPLVGALMGVVRAVYFVWPWAHLLRRDVRIAHEQLADADAVPHTTSPADYAELLLNLSQSRPTPAGALAVGGTKSDLYRRITMLLKTNGSIERRVSRRWATVFGGGLTALAITAAGLASGPQTAGAQDKPAKAPAVDPIRETLEKLKKDVAGDPETVKKLDEALKALEGKPAPKMPEKAAPAAPPPPFPLARPPVVFPLPAPGDPLDLDALEKELVQQQEMMRKMLEGLVGQLGQGDGQGVRIGGIAVGPDGRARVLRGGLPQSGGGRLGVRVDKPTEALAAQLDLPPGQGLVCTDVPADSVAGKAGVKPYDVLMEVAGKSVPSDPAEFVGDLKAIKADEKVDIVVLRKGRKETIKAVALPAAKEPVAEAFPAFPAMPAFPGAQMRPGVPMLRPAVIGEGAGLPGFPAPAAPVAPGVGGEGVRVEQFNDAFTVFYQKDGVKVTVTGTKEDGQIKAESFEVEANGKSVKAESIEKLPKELQEAAKNALKAVK